MLTLLATLVFAWSFFLWGQLDDVVPFPKGFRKWAHVKSVLVGPGKFPDGSVIVYDLLETKEIAGNTLEGPTRRVDVMVKQRGRYRTTGGWEFMSFPGDNQTDGKITAERKATCFGCHAHRKDHDFVFSEFRK